MSLQDRVGRWGEETFTQSTVQTIVTHFLREADELGEALVDCDSEKLQEEAADCLLLLFHLAHRCGFDLHDAARLKFAQVQTRTWGEPDAEGVVEHVR